MSAALQINRLRQIKNHVESHLDEWAIDPTLQDEYFSRTDVIETLLNYNLWIVPRVKKGSRELSATEIIALEWNRIRREGEI